MALHGWSQNMKAPSFHVAYSLASAMAFTATGQELLTGAKSGASSNPLVADKQTMLLMELGIAVLVVAFVIIFVVGSMANARIAQRIAETLELRLVSEFAQIGKGDGRKLLKDGQSYYWWYATGRRYTSGITVAMDLSKRMDMFSHTSNLLYSAQKDRIIFILPLTDDCNVDPVSLYLVKKKELTRLRQIDEGEAVKHVEAFAGEVFAPVGIPSDYVVMTEHGDVVSAYLPDKIRALVTQHSKHVMSIHVATNGAKWEPQSKLSKNLVRVEFTLPWKESELATLVDAMAEVSMFLVDQAGGGKVSAEAKRKGVEMRRRVAADDERRVQKARAEEAAKKREEKKKEEEEAVGKMSREKQMKYEEKKRKKELAARMRKISKK